MSEKASSKGDGSRKGVHEHSRITPLALLLTLLACDVQRPPDKVEALGAPTEVAVSTSNRLLTVAWSAVPGATNYKVAIRPKNQLVPAWREYTAPSSPYTIVDRWAMSGMEYEIRVAAANAEDQSEWSAPVATTAPTLQAASRCDWRLRAPAGRRNRSRCLTQSASICEPIAVALVYLQLGRV